MFYKGFEIIGVAYIASYSTLDDDGRADSYITEIGEHAELNRYVCVIGSPFDIDDIDGSELPKYDSIDDIKRAIDEDLALSDKEINLRLDNNELINLVDGTLLFDFDDWLEWSVRVADNYEKGKGA